MIYDVIYSLLVLIEKLTFFNKKLYLCRSLLYPKVGKIHTIKSSLGGQSLCHKKQLRWTKDVPLKVD